MNTKVATTLTAVSLAAVAVLGLTGCSGTQETPKPVKTSTAAPAPQTTENPETEQTEAPAADIPEGSTPVSNIEGVAYTLPVTFADGQTSAVIQGQTVTCDSTANGQIPAPSTVLFSADGNVVSVACSYFLSDEDNDTLNDMDFEVEDVN